MLVARAMEPPPLSGSEIVTEDFVIAEWQDDGETSAEHPIAPLHVHHDDDEAWYVLEGLLGLVRGDERIEAPAGTAIAVPRGTPHSYWNAHAEQTRYLIVMTRRIATLIEALHQPAAAGRAHEVFREYASELLA
jgi:mannose-6-phosphate isomerase-like protein (cupin superfamily)